MDQKVPILKRLENMKTEPAENVSQERRADVLNGGRCRRSFLALGALRIALCIANCVKVNQKAVSTTDAIKAAPSPLETLALGLRGMCMNYRWALMTDARASRLPRVT